MVRQPAGRQNSSLLPEGTLAALKSMAWRFWGVALMLLSGALWVAMISYHVEDPAPNRATDAVTQNWLGLPGAFSSDVLLQTIGLAGAFLVLPILTWGIRIVGLKGLPWIWANLLAWPFATVFLAAALANISTASFWPLESGYGGFLGGLLAMGFGDIIFRFFGFYPASYLTGSLFGIFGLGLLAGSLGLDGPEWKAIIRFLFDIVRSVSSAVRYMVLLPFRKRKTQQSHKPSKSRETKAKQEATKSARKKTKKRDITTPSPAIKGHRAAVESQSKMDLGEKKTFTLPTLDLLTTPKQKVLPEQLSKEALDQNARLLESVLDDFGIQGEILKVRPGPVVTLYELEPAPGTKSARVVGLGDDIARSMSAISARVAVIPGRNVIGIELPNNQRETVFLRDVLESSAFENSDATLPMALGKDIGGAPVIADLASMPHLLVAGTTGSGKSVGLNAMILSLIYRLSPAECRFIMVDPKMLELSVYDGIPQLLTPVVTEPKKAVVALKWAVKEMEERYRVMSKLGVRNITAYNKKIRAAQSEGGIITKRVQTGFDKETGQPIYEMQEFDLEILPLIVSVIDEMADLMLVSGKDVEATVQRLSQMARAAGIHMVMATQRPSVDVITGTIKSNFPTRIAFQVTSKIDSRTILGEQGAEQLLGRGDMLYMEGGGRVTRIHGPFVSDREVEAVVAHLKKEARPEYLSDVTEEPPDGFDSPYIPGPEKSGNELYDKAVDIVLRDRKASTSYIQRRLRIGYNRAATLIEDMEENGIIGEPNHKGKREILVPERDS